MTEALYEADSARKVRLSAAGVCGSVRVYKMVDRADGKSQMYVLFCYFA